MELLVHIYFGDRKYAIMFAPPNMIDALDARTEQVLMVMRDLGIFADR